MKTLLHLLICGSLAALASPAPLEDHVPDTSHWELMSSFSLSSSIPVYKFRSNLTGLHVVLAEAESPIVNGYFCLATEADTHDGLPHTLEHLIFLGSQEYPYKNVLDLLANRCLSGKTNAWTARDHTCYTVKTAGTSGFLNILPIYMDHILYPLLTDQDFVTEVHHINKEGKDAGVVYSEMQGRENSAVNVLSFAKAAKLYPGGSGYSQSTGGYLKNLRTSTTIEKIRNYHEKFYRPENLVLNIIGRIKPEEVFERLRKIEHKILTERAISAPEPFERPWQKKLNDFEGESEISVNYASEDDLLGKLQLHWRTNKKIAENIENFAVYQLLAKYLTSSQVSPFEAAFVESNDALATSVAWGISEYSEPSMSIHFSNVATDRLHEIVPKADQLLKEIVQNGSEQFDLQRIHNYIDKEVVSILKDIENSPTSFLPDASILDQLYGHNSKHLEEFSKVSLNLGSLKSEKAEFWLTKLEELFINTPKLVVKGIPSPELLGNNTIKEETRIKRQIEKLGPSGLEEAGQLVKDALKSQILPSQEVLLRVPKGDVDSINFRQLASYNRTQNSGNLFDFSLLPYKVHIDHIDSNFVEFYIFMDTYDLTPRQKKFLPLFMNTWLASPMIKDGKIIPISDVINRKSKYLQTLTNRLGFSGSTFSPGAYSDSYLIKSRSTLDNFGEACLYLRDAINYPHFTSEKFLINAEALVKSITPKKSSATSILGAVYDGLFFGPSSNVHHTSFLRQKAFLVDIVEELKTHPENVLGEIETLRQTLVQPGKSFVYLAANAEKLVAQFGADLSVMSNLLNVSPQISSCLLFNCMPIEGSSERYEVRSEQEHRIIDPEKPRHVAVGVGGTESCYLRQSVLYNNTDWTAAEVPILRVMTQYLKDQLFHVVRGEGLSYGVSVGVSVTEGRMYLSLTRSSQLVAAYNKVLETFKHYLNPDNWDETFLESSKGSVVYAWAKKEATITNLVDTSIKTYMWKTDSKYNREFVKRLYNVNLEETIAAAKKFLPLFLNPEALQTAIVCSPAKIDKVIEAFAKLDIPLEKFDSTDLETSFLVE